MRQLAKIETIRAINPIAGADKIEAAQIQGWTVVVKKDEFRVGDRCVFCEIDAMVPIAHPAFNFLTNNIKIIDGITYSRLKTMKLRGVVSQGLAVPIAKFAPNTKLDAEDLAKELGIIKYETPEEKWQSERAAKAPKGTRPFPPFIRKTDQERIQNSLSVIGSIEDRYQVTTKLDGSSMTAWIVFEDSPWWDQAKVYGGYKEPSLFVKAKDFVNKLLGKKLPRKYITGVCSRNLAIQINEQSKDNQFVKAAVSSGLIEKLIRNGVSYAIQGELIAPSIQQNYEKVNRPEWYMYDMFSIDSQKYLKPQYVQQFAIDFGINHVPVHDPFDMPVGMSFDDALKLILNMAEGPGMNPGVKREGLVFKSHTDPDRSFKAISQSYLLHKKD